MKCCVPHCSYEPTELVRDEQGRVREVCEPHLPHVAEWIGEPIVAHTSRVRTAAQAAAEWDRMTGPPSRPMVTLHLCPHALPVDEFCDGCDSELVPLLTPAEVAAAVPAGDLLLAGLGVVMCLAGVGLAGWLLAGW